MKKATRTLSQSPSQQPKKKKIKYEENSPKKIGNISTLSKCDISTQTSFEIPRLIDILPSKMEPEVISEVFFSWESGMVKN